MTDFDFVGVILCRNGFPITYVNGMPCLPVIASLSDLDALIANPDPELGTDWQMTWLTLPTARAIARDLHMTGLAFIGAHGNVLDMTRVGPPAPTGR